MIENGGLWNLMHLYLIQKFEKLSAQYEVFNCELKICDWDEYINDRYEKEFKRTCKGTRQLINAINNYSIFYKNTFSHYMYDIVDYDNGKIIYTIYIPTENLTKLNCKYLKSNFVTTDSDKMITNDEIKKYLDYILNHELGHVIYTNKIFNEMGIRKGLDFLIKKDKEGVAQYYEFLENQAEKDKSDYEFLRESFIKYNSKYAESEANKATGVNIYEIIDIVLKIEN